MRQAFIVTFIMLAMLVIGLEVYRFAGTVRAPGLRAGPVDFTMTDINNQPVTLSSFRGKVVLVEVFATWCHNCSNERPGLIDLQRKANDEHLPLQIIGIAADDTSRDAVRDYVNSNGINYIVLYMDHSQMAPFGPLSGYPTNFIIDKDGNIVATLVGFRDEQSLRDALNKYL